MSIFNQKPQDELERHENDGLQEGMHTEKFKEELALSCLKQLLPEGNIEGALFRIDHVGLTIEPQVPYVKGAVVQMKFVMKHEFFQDTLSDTVAGAGRNFSEVVMQGTQSFVETTLKRVMQALSQQGYTEVKGQLAGEEKQFKLYLEQSKWWDCLQEEILLNVGNKRVYLVKVYAAYTPQGINCECMINGRRYESLTRKVRSEVEKWDVQQGIRVERDVFVLVQDEQTFKPYPLTRKEVEHFTLNALLLLRECNSEVAYRGLYDQIYEACGHVSLAVELYNFIPEMFTEMLLSDVRYSEEVVLNGKHHREGIYRHQLSSYDWIYEVVERTIRAGYFEKEQVDRIITCSAFYNAIREAISKGSKMQDLSLMGLAFDIPETYEIL